MKNLKKEIEEIIEEYLGLVDVNVYDKAVKKDATKAIVTLVKKRTLEVIGDIEPNGKWPLHQNQRIVNRNALRREQYKRI